MNYKQTEVQVLLNTQTGVGSGSAPPRSLQADALSVCDRIRIGPRGIPAVPSGFGYLQVAFDEYVINCPRRHARTRAHMHIRTNRPSPSHDKTAALVSARFNFVIKHRSFLQSYARAWSQIKSSLKYFPALQK